MEIHVNNKLYAVEQGATLATLLQFIQIPSTKGIAIAVNDQVIPKRSWDNVSLSPSDQVTIIRATQGG
ncbi:thiamine biosynthesis protein ThiS [Chitinophaga caeni]|uniref:Thiamine biosynthesis protein ThiS n=1 Tax=Chitinophaga caeni TaxID=2029983 RepID=A0A291QRA3_9BACT|nr:sulfur carrier protein ThiS [Chitinophaga caeni]ATL46539.1 thiamine biosynthesis protein ThiS [Chitinophaga caeni]